MIILYILLMLKSAYSTDNSGYVVYCPCMGRFGNQADHFLGSLAFSKGINRTLVLPPWVEYRYGESKSLQVPFDTYFNIANLRAYHNVVTMEKFMEEEAGRIWKPQDRIAFCYTQRGGDHSNSCNAKNGNPFGPFWDTFNIEFEGSEFYAPLHYDIHNAQMVHKWKTQYPPNIWPVLAFTGAPASFPVQKENIGLQKYLTWNDKILNKAKKFIKENILRGGFVGIHLRNGQDWSNACQHVNSSPTLFSAPQCVGYKNENGPLTMSMCLPDKNDIIRQIKRVIKKLNDIKYIFVASDSNHMMEELNNALSRQEIKVIKLKDSNTHLDLAILGMSNYFIGNCVSSYSAFVKRERDTRGLPSEFWSFPARKKIKHDEF